MSNFLDLKERHLEEQLQKARVAFEDHLKESRARTTSCSYQEGLRADKIYKEFYRAERALEHWRNLRARTGNLKT